MHDDARTARRLIFVALVVFCVGAAIIVLAGCSSSGLIDRLFGDSGASGGSAGDGLPGVRHSVVDTLGSLGLWLSLAGGLSIISGAYQAWRGDIIGGGKAVAIGVGLIVLNGLVKLIVPGLFAIVVPLTVIIGGVVAWRLATGRGVGGHSLRCLLARLKGKAAHDYAHEHDEVNP